MNTPKSQNMRIGQVADSLEVNRQTIKNWMIAVGHEHFSDLATRSTSKRFTNKDVDQLKTIKRLRDSEGINFAEIKTRLAERSPELEILEELPDLEHFEDPEQEPAPQTNAIQNVGWWEYMQERANEWKQLYEEEKAERKRLQADLDWERRPFWQKWRKRPD